VKPPRTIGELLAAGAGGVTLGAVLVIVVDLVFSVANLGGFGSASGVLAVLPAVFIYLDEYRKQPRLGVALLCALLAVILAAGVGYGVAEATGLPPLGSGIVAALAGAAVYAVLWHTAMKGKNP
jgi:O-antigen/teichoic acid export membrane protein